jgi:hypothetical protein
MTRDGKLDARNDSFHNMMKYMVSRCWRKMDRRMAQWHSAGFMHHLTDISGIEDIFHKYASGSSSPKRKDSTLARTIIDLHTSIVTDNRQLPGFPSAGYPKLAAACEEVLSPQNDGQLRVYRSDTWLEFHHLLVDTLNGYIGALVKRSKLEKSMKDARKKCETQEKEWQRQDTERQQKEERMEKERQEEEQAEEMKRPKKKTKKIGDEEKRRKALERKAERESWREAESGAVKNREEERLNHTLDIFNFSHLLWRIAFSQALRDHLGLLDSGAKLQVPTFERYNMGTYNMAVSGEERNDYLARDEEGGQASEEAQEVQQLTEHGGPISIFQRWIQLQVTQWRALDVISAFCGRALNVLEQVNLSISLLQVPRRTDCYMVNWREMIGGLVSANAPANFNSPGDPGSFSTTNPATLDAAAVIKLLEVKIKEYVVKAKRNSIFYKFWPSVEDLTYKILLSGTVHCEAALIFILVFPELFPGSEHSPEIQQLREALVKVISLLPGVRLFTNLLCRRRSI